MQMTTLPIFVEAGTPPPRSVALPASQAASADAPEARATPRRRILVVEDEAIIAWQLEIVLQELGYDVAGTALDATEAIRMAAETTPDAILMDVRLGYGDDGITAAAQILKMRPVPVVFCTAFADDPATAARIEALGAAVLSKPIDVAALDAVLRRAQGTARN
jgi:CheY-like chemotaxis protein